MLKQLLPAYETCNYALKIIFKAEQCEQYDSGYERYKYLLRNTRNILLFINGVVYIIKYVNRVSKALLQ